MTYVDPSALELVEPTNSVLNLTATEVEPKDIETPYIQNLIDRMLHIAAGKGGGKDTRQMVGLAAPQLGVSKRIIFIDIAADGSLKKQNLKVCINPKIISRSKETLPGREGCWSTGRVCGNVERSKRVTLVALDRHGKPMKLELEGFTARIAQHEVDHLNGIRFPDRIPEDEPTKLHWVPPERFNDYRSEWPSWPLLCPRDRWEAIKSGAQHQPETLPS